MDLARARVLLIVGWCVVGYSQGRSDKPVSIATYDGVEIANLSQLHKDTAIGPGMNENLRPYWVEVQAEGFDPAFGENRNRGVDVVNSERDVVNAAPTSG